jgi:hypothetical protein
MSAPSDGKVLLCRLCERTSSKGNRYFTGRLGPAKVIAFIDTEAELKYGATAVFNVYVQDGEIRRQGSTAGAGTNAQEHRHQALGDGDRGHQARRGQRWQRPEPPKADPAQPFHDDDISDIGRDR